MILHLGIISLDSSRVGFAGSLFLGGAPDTERDGLPVERIATAFATVERETIPVRYSITLTDEEWRAAGQPVRVDVDLETASWRPV